MRIAAGVEYDGSDFSGWQRQHQQRTVQQSLEQAITRVADHAVNVVAAGRTDTGVHATGQVVHFDSDAMRTSYQWVRGINTALPDDVSLLWVKPVTDQFHARFSAVSRSYRYILLNRQEPSALFRARAGWDHRVLDVRAMRDAGITLLGIQDFSSFRAAGCQARSPVRHLQQLRIGCCGHWIWFDMVANAFLQHMVRNIVGTLIAVGAGDVSVPWVKEVLAARDRRRAGPSASPHGLYLTNIIYPQSYDLPSNGNAVEYW